jgi:hypothetical protein
LIAPYAPLLVRDWNGDGTVDLMALKNTSKSLFGLYVNFSR